LGVNLKHSVVCRCRLFNRTVPISAHIEGLKQYFNIGLQQKLYSPKSPIYNRDRIGQFGIGKFATLSACKRSRLITQEISLMKDPRNPRQAFERQSKLLRDAFIERRG